MAAYDHFCAKSTSLINLNITYVYQQRFETIIEFFFIIIFFLNVKVVSKIE